MFYLCRICLLFNSPSIITLSANFNFSMLVPVGESHSILYMLFVLCSTVSVCCCFCSAFVISTPKVKDHWAWNHYKCMAGTNTEKSYLWWENKLFGWWKKVFFNTNNNFCRKMSRRQSHNVTLNVHLDVAQNYFNLPDGSHTPNTPEILNSIVNMQANPFQGFLTDKSSTNCKPFKMVRKIL